MPPPGLQNQNQTQNQNQNQNQPPPGSQGAPPAGAQAGQDEKAPAQPKVVEADSVSKAPESKPNTKQAAKAPAPAAAGKQAPPPPVESKPDVAAALAPPHGSSAQKQSRGPKAAPSGTKAGRIIPAVPIAGPNVNRAPQAQQAAAPAPQPQGTSASAAQQNNATQLATAAVAEAMAKLNLQNRGQAPVSDPMNNLAQKVEGMREQHNRQPRLPGPGPGFRGRGGRGGRGGATHQPQQPHKMEVPTTDYDFASANAKFNKQDMVKEAIASGSPLGDGNVPAAADAPVDGQANGDDDVVIPGASYNKSSSFFDNISSELKDREEAASRRGQEFRSEERRKNMETFGQGSVDGYRGGFRGRGRGRGGRGRGGPGFRGGRGAPRGGAPFDQQPIA